MKTKINLRALLCMVLCVFVAIFAANLVSAQGVPVPPPPGMIAWWSFDEASGNQAADRLGISPGAYSNNPVPAPGLVRGSLRFNGTNYVNVPDSSLWNLGSNDFTIEFWVNFDTKQGGTTGEPSAIFVGNDEGPNNRNKWFFALGGGLLEFHINGPSIGPKFFPQVPFSPTVGQWYHLALVRSGHSYTIYINGVAGGSAMDSDVIPKPNASLTIGQAEQIGFLHGRMDELTIYGRALSSSEIQAIYNAGSGGKDIPLAVYPNHGGDTGQVTVLVEGGAGLSNATFSPGATVALKRTGQSDLVANPVTISPDGSSLYATFNLAGQVDGSWDVVTTNEGVSTTIPGGFAVEPGQAAHVWAKVIGPNVIGFGRPAVYTLVVGNDGNVDALGIPVIVSGIPNDWSLQLGFKITPPPMIPGSGPIDLSQIPVITSTTEGQSVPLIVTRVAPGAPIFFSMPIVPPLHSELTTISAVVGDPLFTNPPNLQTPGPSSECILEVANLIMGILNNNLDVKCLQSLQQWLIQSDFTAMQQSLNGKSDTLSYVQLLVGALETAYECSGLVFPELSPVLNGINSGIDLFKAVKACFSGEGDTKPINLIGSVDPNSIFGPAGIGSAQLISGQRPVPYTITFENDPSATAPAQEVIVTDQLDPTKMNLSTVSFGPIAFGNTIVAPPTGANTFVSEVDLRPAQNLIVRIVANMDPNSGVATWHFTSLDPATGALPTDPTIGFLPPGGVGSVQFSVTPLSGLLSGTLVNNSAAVVFDLNAAIGTAIWTNTIDGVMDVSSQISITRGGYAYNRSLGRFVQTVTLKNTGSSAITGPISLVLDNLSANATLFNQAGLTSFMAPTGSAYINIINGNLAPGASVSVALQFADPKMTAITYTTRILASPGIR